MLACHDFASEWADFGDEASAYALDGSKKMQRNHSARNKRGDISWMNAPSVNNEPLVPMLPPSENTSPKQGSARSVSHRRWISPNAKNLRSSSQRRSGRKVSAPQCESPSAKSLPARTSSQFRSRHGDPLVPLQVVSTLTAECEIRSGSNTTGTCTDSTWSESGHSVPSQVARMKNAKKIDCHNKTTRPPLHSSTEATDGAKRRGRSSSQRAPATRERSKSKSNPSRSKSRSRSGTYNPEVVVPSTRRGRSKDRRTSVPTTLTVRTSSRGRSVGSKDRAASAPPTTPDRSCSRDRAASGRRSSSSPSGCDKKTADKYSVSKTHTRPPLTQNNTTRSRSKNRTRSASLTRISNPGAVSPRAKKRGPPPSTYRTRQELLVACSPMRTRTRSEGDTNSIQSFGSNTSTVNGSEKSRKKGSIMEKLFGDQVDRQVLNGIAGSSGHEIRPRILLAATVYHNTATNLWITTINTNQRGVAKDPSTANKFLKAFSFQSEREARESAIANAPPKMVPFNESPVCFQCKGKFALFRRASHCRNCGVCVCSNCATNWLAKMIPVTYNLKNEAQVKVCCSCNALSRSFKQALLDGDLEEVTALYSTGNINLRTPFPSPNKKGEVMYPIHCAVEGGNLNILRWLIDEHYCPIKIHRAKGKKGVPMDAMIVTSKGRSVLGIALEGLKVDIMRYLVVECGVSVYENMELRSALAALEATLTALPENTSQPTARFDAHSTARWDHASFDDFSEPSSLGADDIIVDESVAGKSARSRASSRNGDCCIICFDRKIDCVATPCGHQVICLECSQNLSSCPVCNDRTNFIRIFRP